MLSKLRELFTAPAVSLAAARETIEQSRQTLDSVNALFTAAGLNLEQMLAAGPDALKAHLASLDQADTVATLQAQLDANATELTRLADTLKAEQTAHSVTTAALQTHADLLATIGFQPDPQAKPEAVKTAFAAHVEKRAAALLAQDGRPPVDHIAPDAKRTESPAEKATRASQLDTHYKALAGLPAEERRGYYIKHIRPLEA